MTIIDSQVHAYEANTPKRPWHSVPNWPAHVTGDEMVAAMDKVGVDGAIFISAFSMYRYDASYAVEVQRAHPGRFAIVKPVDPDDPAVGDVIADWKHTPGAVGIRIMLTKEPGRDRDPTGKARLSGEYTVLGQCRCGHINAMAPRKGDFGCPHVATFLAWLPDPIPSRFTLVHLM
jgi:L-fuconolactonase